MKTEIKMNSIETYEDAGRKAGTAARRKDHTLARFEHEWMRRAIRGEHISYRNIAQLAFNDAYRKAFNNQ